MSHWIYPENLEEAVKCLRENDPRVTSLSLNNNDIRDEGAKEIAEALNENTTLLFLCLMGNDIGDEGARALAGALSNNTTLSRLSLLRNTVGTEGARAIAVVLGNNSTLRDLVLEDNNIGTEGAMAVADALKKNSTLEDLLLQHNAIGPDGVSAIVNALKENTALRRLDLDGNSTMDADTEELIKNLLERNKERGYDWRKLKNANAKKRREAEKKKRRGVAPGDCKIMISFNNDSAGEDAEELAKYLTSNGHPTFCTRIYCRGMTGSWRDVTFEGVASCKYYIMLMTNEWQKSNECQIETESAINRRAKREVTFIPVWYEDFDSDFDEKGGLDREDKPMGAKRYRMQFHSIQSIYRRSDKWMQGILDQLGGAVEGISLG